MSQDGHDSSEHRRGELSRRQTLIAALAAVSLALLVAGLFFLGVGRMADAASSPPTADPSGGRGVEYYVLERAANAVSGALLSGGSALGYACAALYIFSPASGRARTVATRAAAWAALAVLAGLAVPGILELGYYHDPIAIPGTG